MLKRLIVALLCVAPVAARPASSPNQVTAHEWGTFTTVAGASGNAVPWRTLAGPSDLPCFVGSLPDNPKVPVGGDALTAMKAIVRMETPVLYFYASNPATVNVRVQLPHGLITEWYPQSTVFPSSAPFDLTSTIASIEWNDVHVGPGATPVFPTEPGRSHYYAARDTDAAPVNVGAQSEKFLFYRGMANFPAPVAVRVLDNGNFVVSNGGRYDISHLVLFENRGGRRGYRLASGPKGDTTIEAPVLASNSTLAALGTDLERMLTEQGLYPREARAMVATWRDSWFEEGARLFYVLPQAAVDDVLPIDISPKPAEIKRVFVGRAEVLTPPVFDSVEQAILANDLHTLNQYGRFLESITTRLLDRPQPKVTASQVDRALRLIATLPESACR